MKKYRTAIIFINLLIILGLFNISVINKEKTLSDGTLILLKLAPVDPRSLMQGDFMRLRYDISQDEKQLDTLKKGYCIVQLNDHKVGSKIRIQTSSTPLYDGEYLIKFRSDDRNIIIGAESYLFQEGKAAKFEKAKYGGIKVDSKGHGILIGLYNEAYQLIQ